MTTAGKIEEHLVIGGGPAGAMAAIKLVEAGCPVTLVEKERGAHQKVCGEFLSGEAVAYLQQIGVVPSLLGANSIRSLRVSVRRKAMETALPFPAQSLSRHLLDAALLERAEAAGCQVRRGAYVENLGACDGIWLAKLSGGETLRARTVFLASGKHDLRGWNRPEGGQADLVGFKMHWRLASAQISALRDFMELFLFAGGYGGLSLVESDVANLCFVVRRGVLRETGGWSALLRSILDGNLLLKERMAGAEPLGARPLAISSISYGYLAGESRGLWRVGDQAAVIPSFTGDGMSIALHSAAMAAQMYLAGLSANEYLRCLRAQLGRGMTVATWLSRAMVTSAGRNAAPLVLSLIPCAMQRIAASTRIPERALAGVGGGGLLRPGSAALSNTP